MQNHNKSLLITDWVSDAALHLLHPMGIIQSKPHHVAVEDRSKIKAVLTRSRTKWDAKTLDLFPHLEVLITSTSGFDHIDLSHCQSRKLAVGFTPEANATAAAELTWALLLACQRHLARAHQSTQKGEWTPDAWIGRELHGRTLGIVGLGRVGRKVAAFAKTFGLKTYAFDPYVDESVFESSGCERIGFDEVFRLCEIVSFHVPATDETRRMFDRVDRSQFHEDLIFINTSRGQIISEEVLTDCLQDGTIAAAGLDVFEKEPLTPNSKLPQFPQLVMTPHIGARTKEALEKASMQAANEILRHFSGQNLQWPLPPTARWYTDPRGYN